MIFRAVLVATSAFASAFAFSAPAATKPTKNLNPKLFPHTPYVPPNPLLNNQHVQTIGGAFLRDPDLTFKADFEESRVRIPTPDGDFFDVDILRRRRMKASSTHPKIAVILHGLESTSTSPLCQSLSSSFVKQGIDEIHCVCFRGCSGSPNLTPGGYHLGFTDDLKQYLTDHLPQSSPKYLSGFSLGANVILKALGELSSSASTLHIKSASLLCVPFDCSLCQPKLDSPGFNKSVYSKNFLKTLIAKTVDQHSRGLMNSIPDFDINKVKKCTTIGEFDDCVVAPIYSFSSNQDYYRKSSCSQYLDSIKIPFLVINANDDPFFDKGCYVEEEKVEMMKAIYTEEGGHCGYLGGWAEETMGSFFRWTMDEDGV